MHLQVERDAGAVDDERHVHGYPERAINLAVRRFHAQRVRRVVNEVKVVAKVLADCDNLTTWVEDALDVLRAIAYECPNRSQGRQRPADHDRLVIAVLGLALRPEGRVREDAGVIASDIRLRQNRRFDLFLLLAVAGSWQLL